MKAFLAITTLACLCFLAVGSVFIIQNPYLAVAFTAAIIVFLFGWEASLNN
jgi:hypothetical protein